MFKIKGKKKGFTLIELIVVIAVLGILVTMGVPRYLGQTKDAKVATMQADTKIVEQAVYQYALNNNDEWPVAEGEATKPDFVELEEGEEEIANIDFSKIEDNIRSLSIADKDGNKKGEDNKPMFFMFTAGPREGQVMTYEIFEDSAGNFHSGLEVVKEIEATPEG